MDKRPTDSQTQGERLPLHVEFLDEPIVGKLQDGTTISVLANGIDPHSEACRPVGYVSTKAGRAEVLGEFSGEPTGTYMPCNAVKGWVGESPVYDKNVSTDQPLAGLRTAFAEFRAARAVKARLR